LGPFKEHFGHDDFPEIGFETDVNAPALSELYYGNHGENVESTAYITVGTGIGIGLVIQGKPIHGLLHPEGGHIFVPISEMDLKNEFKGTCPFHGNCVEGMASSGAVCSRKGINHKELPNLKDDDEIWDNVAHYLAHLCVSIILLTSVDVIVVGGGIFQRKILLGKIHEKVKVLLNGYLKISKSIEDLIVQSIFDSNSGIIGALTLSEISFKNKI
jgi:fructokinase